MGSRARSCATSSRGTARRSRLARCSSSRAPTGCTARPPIGWGIVETLSGKDLDAYFRERIFEPLGMRDTYFNVPEGRCRAWSPSGGARRTARFRIAVTGAAARDALQWRRRVCRRRPAITSRSSDAAQRGTAERRTPFGREREADVREPDGRGERARDQIAQPNLSDDFTSSTRAGTRGLGFLINAVPNQGSSPGSLSWGGFNNTNFWIDPSREARVILMQFLPFADRRRWRYTATSRAIYQTLPTH